MKICFKAPLNKNLHHECQIAGLHMTQISLKEGVLYTLKSPELLKIVKTALKLLKPLLKILFR